MITDELQSVFRAAFPKVDTEVENRMDHLLGNNGRLTVLPKTEEEIAAILSFANQQNHSVTILGGGTKRGFGGVETSTDLVLSLEQYGGLVEHSIGDMTVTVKAGTRFKELQDYLRGHNQMVPLDPVLSDKATIGGVIAANDSGPKRLGYGSARDTVIGLKMMYPDGSIIRTGGKTVKNVAGYDMNKLFIGAMGTLGVITEVTFKLRPVPKYESLVLLTFPDGNLTEIHSFAVSLLDSALEPTAFELLNPALAEKLTGQAAYTLAISFEDVEAAVRYQVEYLKNLYPKMNMLVQEQARDFWARFSSIDMKNAALKIGVKNLDVLRVIRECQLIMDRYSVSAEAHGGLGHGLSKVYLTGSEEQVLDAISHLRQFAEELGGYAIVTHLPLAGRRKIGVWGEKPAHFFLFEGIKSKVDPKRILNPKRFAGGI